MIFDVSGNRIVFGMQWETSLSDPDVHAKARAVKSPYVWAHEKAFYYGVLNEADRKEKLSKPLYSGAIVLQHRYPDIQNVMLVLEIPGGGFIACGLHQGRPRNGCDAVVKDRAELDILLADFKKLCGGASFKIYGDAHVAGIVPLTMEAFITSVDGTAQLRRVKSALVNPLAFAGGATAVVLIVSYCINAYNEHRAAEAQRLAAEAQKSSQTLYDEELTARRKDVALPARAIAEMIAPVRGISPSIGGWPLGKAACSVTISKQVVCTYEFARRENSKATYQSFMTAAGKGFDSIEMAGNTITAVKGYSAMPFIEQGKAIDAARTRREETIEFGSALQLLSSMGKPKLEDHVPFALPPGANVGEMTTPPVGAAKWEFAGPVRSLRGLQQLPDYATITNVVISFTDKPAYELERSMAMATVSGTIFSKSN
ncbi:hypothetical protein [Massilia sp. LjRoot122]|uniref:hypothetical protein n=1 Tax=Massilia sp. LjRoot122 TaxID=3342257 RepID=UPI003ECCCA20